MDNLNIREFRENIIQYTNRTDLPIEVKRLVFEEIMKQLSEAADNEIKIEIARRDSEKKEGAEHAEGVQQDNVGELPE